MTQYCISENAYCALMIWHNSCIVTVRVLCVLHLFILTVCSSLEKCLNVSKVSLHQTLNVLYHQFQ